MPLAIITGYCIGGVLAFFASKWLLRVIANRYGDNDAQRKWIRMVGGIFGALALAPAIFMGVMAGGFLEAHYSPVGARYPAVVLGLAALIVATVTAASAMGALTGFLYARNLFPGQPGG